MDRRERINDPEEMLRLAMEGLLSGLWTALPGIVEAVNNAQGADSMTVDVQPTINGLARQTDGSWKSVELPLLVDCPIVFMGGGGATLTFPVAKGDEALIIFAARCIDGWWASGAVSDAPEYRRHNLSDGFALIGVRSKPRAYAIPSTGARLTADDQATYIELQPGPKIVKCVAPGGINLNGVTIDSDGNLSSPATITGEVQVVAGTGGTAVHLTTHTHPDPQGGNSSAPNPGS